MATGCTDVYATGRKMQQKLYYKQTTRPGALKSLNMEGMMRKWGGGEILKRAVSGMLPKNKLRKPRLDRLKGEFDFGRAWAWLGVWDRQWHANLCPLSQFLKEQHILTKRTSSNLMGKYEKESRK